MTDTTMAHHLVLTGPMGAGKSTLARLLAARLGWQLRDSDQTIEDRNGQTGRQLVESAGVASLHQLEHQILDDDLVESESSVIAAAASVADNVELLDRINSVGGVLIYLEVKGESLPQMAAGGSHRRELSAKEAVTLTATRRAQAEQAGALIVQVLRNRSPDETVDTIIALLEASAPSFLDG